MLIFKSENWMEDELKRRKQLITDLFLGNPLSHIPVEIKVINPKYTTWEYYEDREKQLEDSMESARLTWSMKDKNDLIPALTMDVGCSIIATAFGAEYYFGENSAQTAGVKTPPISDPIKQIPDLEVPDILNSEWIKEGLKRIQMFVEAGDGILPVNCMDAAGGLNVAADLIGLNDLMLLMATEPELIHKLQTVIQKTYLNLIDMEVEVAGGLDNLVNTDFLYNWTPPGFKGHGSDDVSAMIGPEMYNTFCGPYHDMVFEKYGCGGLHNCGPNPCAEAYVSQKFSPRYIDLMERFSTADLPKLKHIFKKKAFIQWGFYGSEEKNVKEYAEQFRGYMELLAPDVILVPTYEVGSVEEGLELYEAIYPIAVEYAQRMDFGFE